MTKTSKCFFFVCSLQPRSDSAARNGRFRGFHGSSIPGRKSTDNSAIFRPGVLLPFFIDSTAFLFEPVIFPELSGGRNHLPGRDPRCWCWGDPFSSRLFLRTSVAEVHSELQSLKKRSDVRNEKSGRSE